MKIVILEDDLAQAELVTQWLRDEQHDVRHVTNCRDFIELYKSEPMDMAILDWQLPDQTGIDVLHTLRTTLSSQMPILFATQRDSEDDIVNALRVGADDYLVKPLRHAELIARLSALSRRAGIDTSNSRLTLGPVTIDTLTETVTVSDEPVKMTQKDYQLAVCIISNPGKILSREYLLKEVWGVNASLNTRTVDVHISRVRRSLKIGPEIGYVIKNIYQHGYRLEKLES